MADINQPLPDRAHEALRLAAVEAITNATDGFYLVDVIFELIDALSARLDALENPTP